MKKCEAQNSVVYTPSLNHLSVTKMGWYSGKVADSALPSCQFTFYTDVSFRKYMIELGTLNGTDWPSGSWTIGFMLISYLSTCTFLGSPFFTAKMFLLNGISTLFLRYVCCNTLAMCEDGVPSIWFCHFKLIYAISQNTLIEQSVLQAQTIGLLMHQW